MKSIGIACFILVAGINRAEATDLTCAGVMHTYNPKHIEATVSPGATIVDLDNHDIATPVGEFEITRVADDSIAFGGKSPSYPGLTIFGTLDRVSGHMTVFWNKPSDTTHAQMYAELTCSKAKRLF